MRPLLPLATAMLLAACSSTPDATELPSDESRIEVAAADAGEGASAEEIASGETYRALLVEGVRGGEITFRVPGSVDGVMEMLLDFDHAAGRRAWARRYETLERRGDRVLARWEFEGHLGINPTVELEFVERRHDAGDGELEFRLTRKAFGLAAFFGDFRLTPAPPGHVVARERVFIDSGTWLANASARDIEEGLREDARLIRAWMTERLATASAPNGASEAENP